ncbi:MAG: anaerobic ribonucleoside-triphosphate reductase activating protein [Candidatus Hermodarchaeota archaeon]
MRVGGIIDISTKDIPQKSAMVIFTVGCNLSCGFCHNKHLLNRDVGRDIKINELIDNVKSNLLVRGVSISGGEPTLQSDLLDLCKEMEKLGKYISIDTNGTNPELIKELLPYINRIALDLKGPLKSQRLKQITGSTIDPKAIIQTINLVNKQKDVDFEIRTTYVGNLMKPQDIHKIVRFLKKANFRGEFVLQQYQYSEHVGEKYKEIYYIPEHITLLKILNNYIKLNLPFQIFIRDNVIGYSNINDIKVNDF